MTAVAVSPRRLVWRRLVRHRLAQASLVVKAVTEVTVDAVAALR